MVVETQGAEDMSKFTPGPWFYAHGVTGVEWIITPSSETTKGRIYIAEIANIGEQTFHNARLIACAPELLEDCKYMLDYCPAGLMQSLAAVIAKAEGTAAKAPATSNARGKAS